MKSPNRNYRETNKSVRHVNDQLDIIGSIPKQFAAACNQLSNLELAETTISSTEVVAANTFTAPNSNNTMPLPEFCRVVGVTSPCGEFRSLDASAKLEWQV